MHPCQVLTRGFINTFMSVYIETDHLVLRDWEDSDVSHFVSMNADPIIMEYFPRRLDEPATLKLVKEFKAHIQEHGYGFFAVEHKESGEFIGMAGLGAVPRNKPFAPATEIAWRFDYEHWGKGYGTEVARALLDFAFDKIGLKEVVAYAVHDNARSIHLMEKNGMVHDESGDFAYPGLPKDNPLGKFVLYRINQKQFAKT